MDERAPAGPAPAAGDAGTRRGEGGGPGTVPAPSYSSPDPMDAPSAAGPASPGSGKVRRGKVRSPGGRRLKEAAGPRWASVCVLTPVGGGRRSPYRHWLRRVSAALLKAQREIRVLKSLDWPDGVAREFFARGARELPRITYAPLDFDPARKVAEFRAIERVLHPRDPLQGILRETARQYADVVRMLEARETSRFHAVSRALYGHPLEPFAGQTTTSLDLALHLDRLVGSGSGLEHVEAAARVFTAEEAAAMLQKRLLRAFPGARVPVEVSSHLTADAAAGACRIRIKRGRVFGRETIAYLLHHEGYVHIATTLNGRRQPWLPILGKASPRTVRVNEGLAVFGEWASHTLTLPRVRRLVDRVLAIRMAEEGADFLQVYRAFLHRGEDPQAAFDIARRVFRGGDLRGGAPFTKDASYLGDFLRIFNFVRVAAKRGRMDLLDLLFVGKVTLKDLPVLGEHLASGEIRRPRFLPPWVRDKNWLTAHMAISSFLNVIHLPGVESFYEDLFARCAPPPPGRGPEERGEGGEGMDSRGREPGGKEEFRGHATGLTPLHY